MTGLESLFIPATVENIGAYAFKGCTSLIDISIEDAMKYALKYTITDLVNMNRAIHPDTLSAYNELMLNTK